MQKRIGAGKKGDKLANWQVRFPTAVPMNCVKYSSCKRHLSDRLYLYYPDCQHNTSSLQPVVMIGDVHPDSCDKIMFDKV